MSFVDQEDVMQMGEEMLKKLLKKLKALKLMALSHA